MQLAVVMSPPSGRGNLELKLLDAVEEVKEINGSKYRCLIDLDSERSFVYMGMVVNEFKMHGLSEVNSIFPKQTNLD